MGLFDFIKRLFSSPSAPPGPPPGSPPVPRQPSATLSPAPRSSPSSRREHKTISLDLDAATFAPLTHDQVRSELAKGPIGFGAWFGRRDRIPPAEDPRTRLIDRAMVGQGLLTVEELTRIHEVGRQMDQLRPDLAIAAAQAQQAVEASKADRARIKAEKKAAAAERKRLHAEAVTTRRKTDIVFLGRGVSKGLADRRSDVEKLRLAGLPVLSTPADVAEALGIAVPRLRWLAFHSDAATVSHYVHFDVPKRSGGTRRLSAPLPSIAAAQQWVLDTILRKLTPHPAAHGFVAGHSTLSNARPHVGAKVLANLDLSDFFPSITFPRVRGYFRFLGYSPAVATVLALLCTESPRKRVTFAGRQFFVAAGPRGLPQGACTSPGLSNLICRRLDSRLSGIAGKLGYAYTRYADDLSFSTTDAEAATRIGYLLSRVRHIAADERFTVNEKKTRVLKPSARQEVTGIVVNHRPAVPRKTRRLLRAVLHDAKKTGQLQVRSRPEVDPAGWIYGMIGYVGMVNRAHGEKLTEQMP